MLFLAVHCDLKDICVVGFVLERAITVNDSPLSNPQGDQKTKSVPHGHSENDVSFSPALSSFSSLTQIPCVRIQTSYGLSGCILLVKMLVCTSACCTYALQSRFIWSCTEISPDISCCCTISNSFSKVNNVVSFRISDAISLLVQRTYESTE